MIIGKIEGAFRLAERPRHALQWMKFKLGRRASPLHTALPWISWKAIDYFKSLDLKDKVVYEYGGGGSTLFFAMLGARVITNETHAKWTDLILEEATRRSLQDRITLATFDIRSPESKAEYLNHIRTIGPWHVALIDGCDSDYRDGCQFPISRMDCLPGVVETVRPGCIVAIDDSWRPAYQNAPKLLAPARRTVLRGLGPHRNGVTQTDVYLIASSS